MILMFVVENVQQWRD